MQDKIYSLAVVATTIFERKIVWFYEVAESATLGDESVVNYKPLNTDNIMKIHTHQLINHILFKTVLTLGKQYSGHWGVLVYINRHYSNPQ